MMIMCSDVLRVGLVTKHIPLSEISRSITREKLLKDLDALHGSLVEDFGIVAPRIAVLALNPHAGDGGLLGAEEEQILRPAIVEAFGKGILAFGPFPADGFFASGAYTKYDGVLAMYNDRGLTPRGGAPARPRHGLRHRGAGQGRSAVDAQRRLCGHRHRDAAPGLGRLVGESAPARRTGEEPPRHVRKGSAADGERGVAWGGRQSARRRGPDSRGRGESSRTTDGTARNEGRGRG